VLSRRISSVTGGIDVSTFSQRPKSSSLRAVGASMQAASGAHGGSCHVRHAARRAVVDVAFEQTALTRWYSRFVGLVTRSRHTECTTPTEPSRSHAK
jgi:hypothetical protein